MQQFRSQGSVEVSVTPDSIVAVSQADFLKSNKNKQGFIYILKGYLLKAGFVVQQAQRDADFEIVQTAVNQSEFYDTVTVVSEDTDIAVLLLHHTKTSNIYLMRPGKGAKADKVTQISTLQQQLGHNIKSSILFLHAMSGCDTTSFLFKKSKKQLLSVFKKDDLLCHRASLFQNQDASKDELFEIGFQCFLKWYGANKVQKLNDYRYIMYNKVTSRQKLATNFNLAVLPPTEKAAKEHILRVYFQVQEWLGRNIDPTNWGWKKDKGKLYPIKTTGDVAPNDILTQIFCNCKSLCDRGCSCKKLNLRCSSKCGNCYGLSCNNNSMVEMEEMEEMEEITDMLFEI